jgi:NodT family efflux transporter outer membrane factor (OMF) lipoprotein
MLITHIHFRHFFLNFRLSLIFHIILIVMLSGCTLRPEFLRPDVVTDQTKLFTNGAGNRSATKSITRWWERLNDPIINSYIDKLLLNNLTLKQATERVIQARERYEIQQGQLYPNVATKAGASRSFTPTNSFAIASVSGGGESRRIYNTNLNADVSISWQADLFGRIRSSVNAAQAGVLVSQYDREAIEHTLIADLLRQRVSIAINSQLLELANQVSNTQTLLFDTVKRRYDLGTANTGLMDVYQAEENTRSVQADIHIFERQFAADIYQLDLLLGEIPGSTSVSNSTFPLLLPPLDVLTCLPVDLLDRRPDLKAAELRLATADAEIGIAMADLYPGINLGTSLGVSGDDISNLFTPEQLAGTLLANLTSRLFEGGSLRANIRLQESEARELSARYIDNVLNAIREVEIALKAEKELQSEHTLQEQSAAAIRNAESLSLARYKQGIEPLRQYLEVQQRRYLIEQNWLRLQQQIWTNRINLYLALGGDWVVDNQNKQMFDDSCRPVTKDNGI